MVKLTPKQQQIYDYILSFTSQHGYPLGAGDRRGGGAEVPLHRPLPHEGLEEAGVIVKAEGKTRAITIPAMPLGAVAEETDPRENQIPILATWPPERHPGRGVHRGLSHLRHPGHVWGALCPAGAGGSLMLGAGILPGDLVVVHRQQDAITARSWWPCSRTRPP